MCVEERKVKKAEGFKWIGREICIPAAVVTPRVSVDSDIAVISHS